MQQHDARLDHLIDRLVDAIDVREAYDPELPQEAPQRIRELERELAREWSVTRQRDNAERALVSVGH